MASKKIEKGSMEWNIFMDLWKIAQDYAIPEENEDYWKSFDSAANQFIERYKDFDEDLAKTWVVALILHKERLQRK